MIWMRGYQKLHKRRPGMSALPASLLIWGAMGVVALMGLVFMQAPNWVHHLLLLMWSLVWGACLLHERGSKVLLPPESTPSVQPPVIQPRAPFSPSDVFVVSAPSTP